MWVRLCALLSIYIFYTYVHLPRNRLKILNAGSNAKSGNVVVAESLSLFLSPSLLHCHKILPKIYSSHAPCGLRIVLIRLHLLGVYLIDISNVIIGLWKIEDLFSTRPSYLSLCLTLARSAENVFPHSASIDLRVRFGIRLAGICFRCESSTSGRDLSVLAKRAQFRIEEATPAEKIRRERYAHSR